MAGPKGLCLGIIDENHWEKSRKTSCGNFWEKIFFHKISIGKTFFKKNPAPKFQLTGPTPCQETLVGSAEPFPTVKGSLGQTANSRGQTAGFDSHLARRLDVL